MYFVDNLAQFVDVTVKTLQLMELVKKIKFSKVGEDQVDEGGLGAGTEKFSTMVKLEVGDDDDQEMTEEVDTKDWMSGEDILLPPPAGRR